MKQIYILFTLFILSIQVHAQSTVTISGTVENADGLPIEQASVSIKEKNITTQTDECGYFSIKTTSSPTLSIAIDALGYESETWKLKASQNINKKFTLHSNITLHELVVSGNGKRDVQMKSAQSIIQIDKTFIEQNFSGSLMQSLEKIPGVKAMSIGSGQSKPTIRGLGFNRMVVAENGIKHEGQQWGEDHGLEIDQFASDDIEIVKGPGSLLYGSEAIGGVISLRNKYVASKPFEGRVNLFARSNNESLGFSTQLAGKKDKFQYRANITIVDYADYKVPTDSIQYYSYYIKLKNRRLRNTAGKEQNLALTSSYTTDSFRTQFTASNVYAKGGFFANAHGLEVRLSEIDYDKSSRDIDMPYHSVNHFKLINNTIWHVNNLHIEGNFAYQNNLRKEFAEAVSHGYMPIPPHTLEREFDKDTFTAQLNVKTLIADKHSLNIGISGEHQNNKRDGWGFIVPDFRTTSFGVYIFDRYHISDNLIVSAGARVDRIETRIDSYQDWYKTPISTTDSIYKQRAANLSRSFNSFTWSLGINYNKNQWNLKANIGKSFRAPIPKELGSDGINYHIFRYEKGDATLSPEESYQFDTEANWKNDFFEIQVAPFVNYFPNYIYLNPTANYNEGLQIYHYTQSKVLRYGAEAEARYRPSEKFEVSVTAEYLYSEQLSGDKKGYTLPFSPPWTVTPEIKFMPKTQWAGKDGFIALSYKIVGNQDEIVPPEKPTKGYQSLNLSAGRAFSMKGYSMRVNLQGQNLLNKKYYDHTSYYRLIDVPEPGRNFSIMLGIEF